MKILVSNDDGWQSAGIAALYQAMCEIAEVKLVAPDRNCSAASSALSLINPIRATEQRENIYSLQGTPADCVNIALNGLLDWTPDLVVTGINHGANLGDDVIYSGTVAAALEGVLHGVPGIAFSQVGDCDDFTMAASVAKQVVSGFMQKEIQDIGLINVNIPPVSLERVAGFTATRLGVRMRGHTPIIEQDPRGNDIYWIGPVGEPFDAAPGTDFHAISNQRVSLTPISIDLTHHAKVDWLGQMLGEVAA